MTTHVIFTQAAPDLVEPDPVEPNHAEPECDALQQARQAFASTTAEFNRTHNAQEKPPNLRMQGDDVLAFCTICKGRGVKQQQKRDKTWTYFHRHIASDYHRNNYKIVHGTITNETHNVRQKHLNIR